jgi:hypothetical protein
MNKLKLELDDLRVESFDTGADHETRGTVMGLGSRIPPRDGGTTTDEPITYAAGSCNGGLCTNDYGCIDSWANGCQSDPNNPTFGC